MKIFGSKRMDSWSIPPGRPPRWLQRIVLAVGLLLFIAAAGLLAAIILTPRHAALPAEPQEMTYVDMRGNQELAYLLVRLELQTRAVIGEHYTRAQSQLPELT